MANGFYRGQNPMIFRFDEFEIDTLNYQLQRQGQSVEVEPKVFDLLSYLVTNRSRLVSRDELFENLWPGQVVSDTSLSNQINAARKAVGDNGQKQALIKTVHGRGYQFIATVEEIGGQEVESKALNEQVFLEPDQSILPLPDIRAILN